MPQFRITRAIHTHEVSAIRAQCDGCDPGRPCDEHTSDASLWLVTAGAFELRDAGGRHMIDPTRAIVMPRHHAFRIRHPAGPDTCLSFRGPIVEALAAHGARLVAISPAQVARVAAALADHDELALAEVLAELAPIDPAPAPRPDRALAAAVADALRARYAEPTSLGELATTTGYSVFHTCRVFRATTGTTIHGFRRELRLRHALARILDSEESLSHIAAMTGFASQSHLTNLFRARFGLTPAKLRTKRGQRALGSLAG
ncbi:MAG TPA: helix-turn-helix transcriptional regulator [Kofleriaceae bacterium]|nr:helix-turn-helix transcriptional regulator [Kofleriaceae bacterium]